MASKMIYLDYNATTPCDMRVVEKMLPYFGEWYGNPANGLHAQGRKAARAMSDAREQVAALIGAYSDEIFFTSGATESNNLAIFGISGARAKQSLNRIVTTEIEHKAVLLPFKKLQEAGFELCLIPVDRNGRIIVDAAEELINTNTLLVSAQIANNEVGTIQPVAELAALAHKNGALMHCDAAQGVGKIPVDVAGLGVDLLSMSAHKLYGPKGIGGLYIRNGLRKAVVEPQLLGGGQEKGMRSGTSNVPGIVGFGEACALASGEISEELRRVSGLRDTFQMILVRNIESLRFHGVEADRLPNTLSVTFPGIDADAYLLNMPELMLGTGSACTSGTIEPSHVLQAMGISRSDSYSTIRISLGRYTKSEEVDVAATSMIQAYRNMT